MIPLDQMNHSDVRHSHEVFASLLRAGVVTGKLKREARRIDLTMYPLALLADARTSKADRQWALQYLEQRCPRRMLVDRLLAQAVPATP